MSEPYLRKQKFDLLRGPHRDRPAKLMVKKIYLHFLIYYSMQQSPVAQWQLFVTEEATEVGMEPFASSKIHSAFGSQHRQPAVFKSAVINKNFAVRLKCFATVFIILVKIINFHGFHCPRKFFNKTNYFQTMV